MGMIALHQNRLNPDASDHDISQQFPSLREVWDQSGRSDWRTAPALPLNCLKGRIDESPVALPGVPGQVLEFQARREIHRRTRHTARAGLVYSRGDAARGLGETPCRCECTSAAEKRNSRRRTRCWSKPRIRAFVGCCWSGAVHSRAKPHSETVPAGALYAFTYVQIASSD